MEKIRKGPKTIFFCTIGRTGVSACLVQRLMAPKRGSDTQTRFQPFLLCLDSCRINSPKRGFASKRESVKSYRLELLRQSTIDSNQ
ncbi:hypothetical protein MTR_3g104580 [Medicago truncatula]|uniref:Uncharacterized protein n=1 Tax=Medicago truncatula TaxID=3880 RepID=G7J7P4_MEDTR|nr:hypothetical protein MTR_3g104580 [Medicago truncatula]